MTDTDNLNRRRFLQATGGAASAVALAGCTGGNNDSQDTATTTADETTTADSTETTTTEEANTPSDDSNVLRLINSTMTTLDPIKATDTASGTVIQQVFDALMNYPNAEIEVKSQLAKSHTVSDDFKTYTFKLKEGAKFHNGTEVTAQDFVYSFERLAASDNSRRAYFILDSIGVKHETDSEGNYKPGSMAVTAEDDYTLKMELSEPFHAVLEMLAYTSFAALPKGIVGDIKGHEGEMSHKKFSTKSPVGAGPFTFDTWSTNTEARVSKFENYHGSAADVDGVHWNIMSDPQAMYTYGTVNQNADMLHAGQLPTSQYNRNKVNVKKTDKLGRKVGTYGKTTSGATMKYTGVPTIGSYYIGFNAEAVPKAVRQAAAYALNQGQAVNKVFKGRGESSYHFTPPSIYPGGPDAYKKHAKENYPYGYNETKLAEARKVMKEAGYGKDNKFSFEFTVYQSSSTWPELGKLLRDKLASAYIDMSINTAPFSTLLKRGRKGNLEAYSLGWIMDYPAPDNFLQLIHPPKTDTSKSNELSYFNWSGTEAAKKATKAWEKVQNNPKPTDAAKKKRNEAYVAMEEANWEDVVLLPAYHDFSERFTYDWIDAPRFGAADYSRQMYNNVKIGERK
ncbi:ABC transporter substrate-binding protein [Halorussus gelatinilyticus]|uniref:ABC transporter substrate-binding protein n=1 Tax=Halorussus gelatinilyticus TaxID=2937524 RepID=A0A8U0IMV6_9EURY|nr:ABC transporter substrate-binding protein [Halorussus gelatinilyticus]UPW01772.1 ABC transporter substrate-binding protein [Halorussus gelatinilyticus]